MSSSDKKSLVSLFNHLSDSQVVFVYSDDKWVYPMDLPINKRDQKNCKMLDVMFQVEKKKGIIIHIPNITLDDLVDSITKEQPK